MHNKAANWPERPLGELLDIARQTMIPGGYPAEQFIHYSIPAWDETRGPALEIGASIGSAKICIKQPTILVSKLNPRIPRVVLVESPIGQQHCASTEFIPYVAKADNILLRFYKWFLQSPMFQRRLEHIATGSTNSHTRAHPAETLKWNVPFPALEEQCRIAAVLDTVEEAVTETEAVIAKLKQVRTGLLHDLLTRGLDENGQLRDPISHPEQFQDSPLGRLPREWEVVPVYAVCEEIVDCKNRTPPYTETGYPVVRTANVRDGQLLMEDMLFTNEAGFREWTQRRIPAPGDLLITREAPVGQACLVPEGSQLCLGQRMMLFAVDRAEADPGFLLQFILSDWMQRKFAALADGSTVGHVRLEEMKTFLVPKAGLQEQAAIAQILGQVSKQVYVEIAQLEKLRNLKSGLMSDLLTGRVRVQEEIAVAP